MLDLDAHLTFDTLMRVFDAGHSRVPVYQAPARPAQPPPPRPRLSRGPRATASNSLSS